MTPEEIDKLAKEFAKEYAAREYPNAPCEANYWIVEARTESMKENLRFLLRTHCIVSKEKATELCRLTLEHGDSIDYGLIDGLTDIVCDIFGEQYHAEAEKTDFDPDTINETDK